MSKEINQLEFIKSFCKNSKITPDKLNELNQIAVPCNCGEPECKGWAMINRDNLSDQIRLYFNPIK